jgi:L-seryl-tRNA(Ser) seleniumtransferase
MDSFYNFTGLHRNYLVEADQIALAEEWTGQALYWEELVELTREHFGGKATHDVAVFNRATAGIVAACMALAKRQTVVLSVTPGSRSHPSISRGMTWPARHC